MAFGLAETAELAVRISLKDDLSRGINGLTAKVSKLQSGLGKVGTGLKNAARNLTIPALAVGGLLGVAVSRGLEDLSTLESAVTSVDGAIKQMGLTGKVTGQQVADWANEIEADIGAAFDDKAITQAATTLIRFGKVSEKNLRPALEIVADLATKTGDVESASTLLAKALADPAKAAGKLARAGIVLTKAQQKQIKAMLKSNDVAGAQALILDEVRKSTEGAAEASQGKYARAMAVLADVQEDARKALAEGFLPVITKVADLLSTELAKPQTLQNIREFGEGLAAGLDSLITIARGLPWGTIGQSLQIAGAGAKAVLQAFTGLPPWIQTAVITGWGLNKLTGGLLGDVVGELGKGLIKGVLGMNAGVVNINAGVVNGPGGVPGVGGGGGLLGLVGRAALPVAILSIGAGAAIALTNALDPGFQGRLQSGDRPLANRDPRRFDSSGRVVANWEGDLKKAGDAAEALGVRFGRVATTTLTGRSQGNQANSAALAKMRDSMSKIQTTSTQQRTELGNIKNNITTQTNAQKTAAVAAAATTVLQGSMQAARDALERLATSQGATKTATASTNAGTRVAAAQSTAASRIVAAIWAARPVIQTTNVVNNYSTKQRTGATSGSRNGYVSIPGGVH